MARLPNLTDRDQLPEHLRDAYDRVAALRQGSVSGPYGVLLHSPELAEAAAALGNYARWRTPLTPAQREVAVLAVARALDAELMWGSHARLAAEAGVPPATVDAIARGDAGAIADADAALIVRFVRELFETHRVSAEAFDGVRARLGDQGVVDLTGLAGYYAFVGSVLNAFEVEPPPGAAPLPPR